MTAARSSSSRAGSGNIVPKPKLLIDADLIIYRSAAAVERDIRWDEENHMLVSNEEDVMVNVERAVDRLTKRFDTDDVLMCISTGRNFRYDVDPSYKANRKGTRKPLCYGAAVERIEASYPSFKHEGIEADDVMGIFATRDENTIICSMDKDMKTIPCTLYDGKTVRKIDKATADWWFFYQVLVGDTADGYTGLPGCGPVKAEKILGKGRSAKDMWEAVKAAYIAKGLTEDHAIKQARMARILRSSDWNAKKRCPILWTP